MKKKGRYRCARCGNKINPRICYYHGEKVCKDCYKKLKHGWI